MFFTLNKKNKGFTLVEMIIYVALMTVITLVVVQSMIVVLKSNRTSFVEMNIRNSGYSAMEAMLRGIHSSISIITASSGLLEMNQDDNTVAFSVSNGVLNYYEGSTLIGPLTSKGVTVKNLLFTPINTGKSLAIRIQMELQASTSDQIKNDWFYLTAILRGSY